MHHRNITIIVGLISTIAVSTFASAYGGSKRDRCLALEKAINKRKAYAFPELPPSLKMSVRRKDSNKFFAISADLWKLVLERKKILKVIRDYQSGKKVNDADQKFFRQTRVLLKQLRFAYVAFSKDHECPPTLDRVAVLMGQVKDASNNRQRKMIREKSEKLARLIDAGAFKKIDQEIEDFKPANRASFEVWLSGQIDELETPLEDPEVTAHEFHEVRKAVGRLVAVFDTFNAIEPDEDYKQVVRYLSTINEKMESVHDDLVSGKLDGTLDYDNDPLVWSEDIKSMIKGLIELFEGAMK